MSIRIFILPILIASMTQNAEAQQASTIRLGLTVAKTTSWLTSPRNLSGRPDANASPDRAARTAHGALIGAGIGAATGLVVAVILTNQAKVTDHSEDALGYIALTSFGAFVGLVVGGIVGFVRA